MNKVDGLLNVINTTFDTIGRSTAATAAVWLASALLLWAAYAMTLRAFCRAEATEQKPAGAVS